MSPAILGNGLNRGNAPSISRLRLGRLLVVAAAACALVVQARADVYAFTMVAGNGSLLDHTDGTGGNARFFNPAAVAVDASGNIYVADSGDHTIRRVTAGGVVTTIAGSSGQPGSSDGSSALFLYPAAVAVDASGNLYVADSGNQNIRKISAGGSVSTLAGTTGVTGSMDGTGAAALFNQPQGIAVDAAGNVYVSDTGNSTIRKITAAGAVTTLAGVAGLTGGADGAGSAARFDYPEGIAADSTGAIFVADSGNSTIREVTPAGSVSTLAGIAGTSGSADGQGSAARFNHPESVAVDQAGSLFVIDTSNQTVREVSPTGSVSTLAGSPGIGGRADGTGAAATFFYPGGIASTAAGVVYIADTGNHLIRAMAAPGAVATLAGSLGQMGYADATGSQAFFAYPHGLSADGSGHLFVADANNNAVRAASSAGLVTTLAGLGGVPAGSVNGVGTAARFSGPAGVAADASGNVYVADTGNSTIRKIAAGGTVTVFAGAAGIAGSSDGAGAAARFNAPEGIAVDSVGNVYVADSNNNTVRKITPGGTVTTLAGVAGQSGSLDGPGASARFNGPFALAVDSAGNVYVSDLFNATIRKIDISGTVSTPAGAAGQPGFADGVGSLARFNQPYALAVDASGNVYVADTFNRAIRKIAPGGTVTTLNGSQTRFYYPQGIALDGSGNLYVADGDNQAVSVGALVVPPPVGSPVAADSVTSGQNASFTVSAAGAAITYQWQTSVDSGTVWTSVADDATFGGATTATLTLADPPTSMSGDQFRVLLTNPAGTNTSGVGTLTVTASVTIGGPTGSARIINLSIRSFVGTGANALTVGFAISGSGSKQLLIRAVGPTLADFDISGFLTNPQLSLFDSAGVMVDANTGWGGGATLANAFSALGAFALPAESADSALYVSLAGDTTYTAEISGTDDSSGVALAELYDADGGNPPARLTNVSARSFSGTGSSVLTAGFVIGGTGTDTLLIRGIGPGLTQFGVAGVLATPTVTVFDSSGNPIGTNTGWGGGSQLASAFAEVGAFALPAGSADSAILVTLPSGDYTVEVAGADDSTGVALVEVYEVN